MIAQIDSDYFKSRPLKVIPRLLSYSLFEGRPVTTKGQWINSLVFAHFSLEKAIPQLKKVRKPIFITGSGRSGTTMLGVLMSMHKDVSFLNEPKAMWHSIYSEEDVIGSYGQNQSAKYTLDDNDANEEVCRNANKLFGAYLRATFNYRVVDKYPEHIFRINFVKKIFPDAKFIFLVRNGWDTCASIDKWSKRLGKKVNDDVHDWWGINQRKWELMKSELVPNEPLLSGAISEINRFSDHLNMAAVEWIITMQYGLRQIRDEKQDLLLVKYEGLVANPARELLRLLQYCDLDNDPVLNQYAMKTLQPGRSHNRFDIHESIRPAFEKTMDELCYK